MTAADRPAIVEFLAMIGQDLHLCSIKPDGRPSCRWFGADVDTAAAWAVSENGHGKNLYWTVNVVEPGRHEKPSKSDIVSARFVHVDIDPPKEGGGLDKLEVQARLLCLPVPPSIIIDSGNGLQAFWRLVGPAELHDVERINACVAISLSADRCHSIEHLMRLPGTVNFPNAKKLAAGRTTTQAKVLYNADGLHC